MMLYLAIVFLSCKYIKWTKITKYYCLKGDKEMASLSFELEQFPQGYFLVWDVLTQCGNTVNVTLKAGNTTYFSANKSNGSANLQLISNDSRDHNVNATPILTITVNGSSTLKQSFTSGAINDQRARKVGYVYDFCIEDWVDDDYNDIYINIVGWAKKG